MIEELIKNYFLIIFILLIYYTQEYASVNNSYYVLSKQYKQEKLYKNLSKSNTKKMCIICNNEPQDVNHGDFKEWCKSCKDLDLWIDDWSMACWEESLKPNPDTEVYIHFLMLIYTELF